jgi:hypothetical protein
VRREIARSGRRPRHERGVGLDAVPEELHLHVFVLGVLVVVGVHDGHDDALSAQHLFNECQRERAAERGELDDRVIDGRLHGGDHVARDRQIHGRALRVGTLARIDAHQARIPGALDVGRITIERVPAAGLDVGHCFGNLALRVVPRHQPEIERDAGDTGDDIRRVRVNIRALDPFRNSGASHASPDAEVKMPWPSGRVTRRY